MTDIKPEKESIVKTLLTSTTPASIASCTLAAKPSSSLHYIISTPHNRPKVPEELVLKKHSVYSQASGMMGEKELAFVAMDHCYAKPANLPNMQSTFYQPTKVLFAPTQVGNKKKFPNPLVSSTLAKDNSEEIDVETVELPPPELYDRDKAIQLMNECENYVMSGKANQDDDWEETVPKTNWTDVQEELFNGMANILNSDRLARLASTNMHYEPILRRTLVDKSVKRVRRLFNTISWDCRLTQWLHQLLIDHLSASYLAAYLDILQTLKAKLPVFVDKMMYAPNANSRMGVASNENLFPLLKRSWDPYSSYLSQNRPRKLPGNSIIIVVPSTPMISNTKYYRRQQKWINLLSNLASVVTVHSSLGNALNRLTMMNCADQMLSSLRTKIQEVKTDYPDKSIVLVGFNAGSALALQAAQVESVFCVVCLGFSLLTAEGRRGEPDDSLLELRCPVLFVIGQCSNTSLQEDMEDLRERMRLENGLIVVGSADDYLRVSKKTKRSEGITQSAVDRIIVENVGEFIGRLQLSPCAPNIRHSPTRTSLETTFVKRPKIERKRNNSNTSSLEGESPSLTPKMSRPVGRPPGSKSKAKLEAKWAAQVAQGIPSHSDSPSPPILHPITPEASFTPLMPPTPHHPPDMIPVDKSVQKFSSIFPAADKMPPNMTAESPTKSNNLQQHKIPSVTNMKTLNRSVLTTGSALSNLLQSGGRPLLNHVPQSKQTSIKVLDNLTLNPNSTAKLISSTTGRSIDLSKITVLNNIQQTTKSGTPVGNVVLMPDGKLKSINTTVKGTSSSSQSFPSSNKKILNFSSPLTSAEHRVAKYITSKKQLIGRKPPHPVQKPSIMPSYSANLPPPTNLTSQDIMDLPIIFADDNQMLTDNSKLQQSDVPVPEIVHQALPQHSKLNISGPIGKFVFINKQMPPQPTSMTNTSTISTAKRPTLSVPVRSNANPVKYTKIIISRAASSEPKTSTPTTLASLPSEISVKKIESLPTAPGVEAMDLESAIAASTIPNPRVMSDYELKNTEPTNKPILLNPDFRKRTSDEAGSNNGQKKDVEYIPQKSIKTASNSHV